MAVNIGNKQVIAPTPDKLVLNKDEVAMLTAMLAEAQIKIKDIQNVTYLQFQNSRCI